MARVGRKLGANINNGQQEVARSERSEEGSSLDEKLKGNPRKGIGSERDCVFLRVCEWVKYLRELAFLIVGEMRLVKKNNWPSFNLLWSWPSWAKLGQVEPSLPALNGPQLRCTSPFWLPVCAPL